MTRPPISRPGSEREYEPGREDDVLAGDGVVADLHRGGRREPAFAFDRRDAAGLDESLQSLVLAGDDALAIRGDRSDVDAVERRC